MDYALRSPLSPRVSKVVYLGGEAGAAWLDRIGVSYQRAATLDTGAGWCSSARMRTSMRRRSMPTWNRGGKAFSCRARRQTEGSASRLKPAAADFAGSLSVPEWPEARGVSASDLRWRTHLDTAPWVVSAGADIGADGLIGRKVIGKGVAVFCQVDPDRFQADEKTYFRYTRWRSTRAVAQLLANLGASFPADSQIFRPLGAARILPSRLPHRFPHGRQSLPLLPVVDVADIAFVHLRPFKCFRSLCFASLAGNPGRAAIARLTSS